ncbi:hypothetical protein VCHA29O37_330013 [Vibrio chagasii]|nr:hypothetical protein VCHA29O37_330013 [Vibrio chagasii]
MGQQMQQSPTLMSGFALICLFGRDINSRLSGHMRLYVNVLSATYSAVFS